MSGLIKRILIVLVCCLFLLFIVRAGTSTYENHMRSIGSAPYTR